MTAHTLIPPDQAVGCVSTLFRSFAVFTRLRLPHDLIHNVDQMEGQAVVQAYILIQTEVGKAAAVAAEVSSLPGVASAEDVTGPYDVIVRAEASDVDQLGQLVVARVQNVQGITRTLTCPVVHLS